MERRQPKGWVKNTPSLQKGAVFYIFDENPNKKIVIQKKIEKP